MSKASKFELFLQQYYKLSYSKNIVQQTYILFIERKDSFLYKATKNKNAIHLTKIQFYIKISQANLLFRKHYSLSFLNFCFIIIE